MDRTNHRHLDRVTTHSPQAQRVTSNQATRISRNSQREIPKYTKSNGTCTRYRTSTWYLATGQRWYFTVPSPASNQFPFSCRHLCLIVYTLNSETNTSCSVCSTSTRINYCVVTVTKEQVRHVHFHFCRHRKRLGTHGRSCCCRRWRWKRQA